MDDTPLEQAMALSKALNSTAAFLENYWGRNQVYRTAQFASILVAGLIKHKHEKSAENLIRVATAISDMRVLLRLMDDIPVLVHTLRSLKSCKATRNVSINACMVKRIFNYCH